MGPDGCPPVGWPAMLFDRPNKSWKVWLVTEARRRGSGEWRGGEFRSLEDILVGRCGNGDARVCGDVCVSKIQSCGRFVVWNEEYKEAKQGGEDG